MTIQVPNILLTASVLALLVEKDGYGYSLTQKVKKSLGISESTLYPVMRRLETEGYLTTYDAPHNGRNRRYYKITEQGLKYYNECLTEWRAFKKGIEEILTEGEIHG